MVGHRSMKENVEDPTVSIIVPTYNSGKTLEKCLRSIDDQTYASCEKIVVDSFSNDNTLTLAKSFGARIVQHRCNAALARNIGVANSTGQYVLFMDSDQVLSPSVVEDCVEKCLEEHAEMVRIPELFVGEDFWDHCSAIWKNYFQKAEQIYGAHGNILSGEPRFFLKERILQVGMLDVALVWGEDLALYEKLKEAHVKEARCKSYIFHYELASIKELLSKNLRYGKSIPTFKQETKRGVYRKMLRHALLTFREIFSDFARSPTVIMGCLILLCLKAYAMAMTLPLGLLVSIGKKKQLENRSVDECRNRS